MLVQSLGKFDIQSHEIVSDPAQLRSLSQVQESHDWFVQRDLEFARGLPTVIGKVSVVSMMPPIPETTISLAKEFEGPPP